MSDYPRNDWRDYLYHSSETESVIDHVTVYHSENDWRDYLAHSWGTEPKQKAREKEYNHEYYEKYKEEKWGVGKKGKISVSDSSPEWLKKYIASIEKMRESTGDSSWIPKNINDYNAWLKELKTNFPGLSITDEQAREMWNTIKRTLSGNSSSSNNSDASSEDTSSNKEKSSKSSSSKGSKKSKDTDNSEDSDKTKKETEEKKEEPSSEKSTSENNKKVFDALAENYRKGANGEIDAYKDDGTYVSAYDDYGEWQAEMMELGADENNLSEELWEEFKKTRPKKQSNKVMDTLAENYRKGANGEIDAYKDDGEDSAYGNYGEWQAEMMELGANEKDLSEELWEEFKKTRPNKRND